MKKESCLVLMDAGFSPLGEVLLEDGDCRQVNLNQYGDVLLGPMVSEWQTQGLDHWRTESLRHGKEGEIWQTQSLTLQSADFLDALVAWLEDHGFHYIELPLGAMLAWSQIQQTEKDAAQKYELAVMLRDLPIHKIAID